MATEVDEYGETGGDQSLFSGSETQTTTENPCNPTVYINGNGTWETKVVLYRLTDNPTCPCEEAEDQTTDRLIFRCKELHNQRTEFIKEIKNNGGDWPIKYEMIVKYHIKAFIKFDKTIDSQIYDGYNDNRNR